MSPPPRGGHFPVSMVCLARDLIVHAGASLRCAAAALALIVQHWDLDIATPSFSTIRSWLLRLGCYALCCPLPCDVPWVWFIDHTIQVGSVKLFVILGCPLGQVPFGQRSLSLADLQLIALVPMEQSNHQLVDTELEKATARTGTPRLIVSDHAPDLKKGIEEFQRRHSDTVAAHDIAHYGANLLENRWERDPRWKEMLSHLHQSNQKMRQTAEAYLLAPTLRPKARFMNVGPLLRFLSRVMRLLEAEKPNERVESQYGWLRGFREELSGWLEQHRLVQTTLEWVRVRGLNSTSLVEVEKLWGELSVRRGTTMVAGYLRVYLRRYGGMASEGETLVGSSEVLESSFGKLKRLEGDACQDGFTGMVLALGAFTGTASETQVREALEEVPNKEADNWIKRTLGATLRWLRRHLLGESDA